MRTKIVYLILSALSLLLVACGGDDPDPGVTTRAAASEADENKKPAQETIIDDHLKAIERAKAVEADVLQHQHDKLKEIDEASGG